MCSEAVAVLLFTLLGIFSSHYSCSSLTIISGDSVMFYSRYHTCRPFMQLSRSVCNVATVVLVSVVMLLSSRR